MAPAVGVHVARSDVCVSLLSFVSFPDTQFFSESEYGGGDDGNVNPRQGRPPIPVPTSWYGRRGTHDHQEEGTPRDLGVSWPGRVLNDGGTAGTAIPHDGNNGRPPGGTSVATEA